MTQQHNTQHSTHHDDAQAPDPADRLLATAAHVAGLLALITAAATAAAVVVFLALALDG